MAEVKIESTADKSLDDGSISVQAPTKLSIIDHELNRHGMCRYHWLIWAICGTGFMLDLMWAQAYSLALPNIQREFGFSDKELGNIGAVYGAGVIVGAFVWGTLVDVVGRRVAFFGTSLVSGVFGMCSGAVSSYSGFQAFVAIIGFGTGGNIPIDSTITTEYLPQNYFYLLSSLAIFAQVGSVTTTLLAFGLLPDYSCSTNLVSCHLTGGVEPCCSKNANMGWRYLFFAIASITLGVFIIRFFIFPFYESPKFLASKGNDRGAVEVVRKVAAFNKHSCDLTVESLQSQVAPVVEKIGFSRRLVSEVSRLKLFFGSWKMTRITILVWSIWILDYWAVSIANTYMPTILQRTNNAAHISLKQTYIDYLIIHTPGIAAAILSVPMVRTPLIGRKWTLVFACVMMGISLFLYSIVNTQASHVGLNALLVFFQLLFNSVLWGWTPEAFPIAIRGTASGLAMVFAALFSIFGPVMAAQLFDRANGSKTVLYLSGSGLLLCLLALLCLPAKHMVVSRQV